MFTNEKIKFILLTVLRDIEKCYFYISVMFLYIFSKLNFIKKLNLFRNKFVPSTSSQKQPETMRKEFENNSGDKLKTKKMTSSNLINTQPTAACCSRDHLVCIIRLNCSNKRYLV